MTDPIRVVDVSFRYGRHRALDGLSLSVPGGAICGLIGENGAGKSTTFGILAGWLRPGTGHAEVLGQSPLRLHRLRGAVGIMPQDADFPAAMPIVAELSHYARLQGAGAREARRMAEEALDRVGLADAKGRRGSELSHGMRKRVAFAQATLGSPRVVLLDEPTNGLDPRHARLVKDLIAGLAPAATVLISSHQLQDLQELCTHAAYIHGGRLLRAEALDVLTARNAEVHVRLVAPPDPGAMEAVAGALGAGGTARLAGEWLVCGHGGGMAVHDAVGCVTRALLEAGVGFVEVRPGGSLEASFLESTGGSGAGV